MIVRRLYPWEWNELQAHLLRLGPEERRLRFCRRVDDAAIAAYCDRVDRPNTKVLGCFISGTLRGVAELIEIPQEWPKSAEIALSVEKPFQRQGIGGRLLGQVLLLARNRMIRIAHLVSLRENEPLQLLARKFGARTETYLTSTEARIGLPWPSYLSLLEEMSAEGHAFISAAFELSAERKAG
jgi:GNAT superfamily N-acetyltransferase